MDPYSCISLHATVSAPRGRLQRTRVSYVVRRTLAREPQCVTRHGRDAVVVVRGQDYERVHLRDWGEVNV